MVHLVFFDTFSHEVNDAPTLDLVQFPKPVQVNEVRVIPLGARVKADFPGGVRLGATNPSQFEVDFYVNDLGKRGAAAFENVGHLQYNQQGPIKLDFDKAPPTDGLLLRGSYNTITLAVYGCISKANRDSQSTPPPPAPLSPPLQQNSAPVLRDHAPSPAHLLSSPRSTPTAAKRDGGIVVNPPTLPHPLPEKVNPNERIRDWLQDTQIPHSPLDLDSPTKAWDDPPYDSDAAVGPGLAGKDGLSSPQSREFSLHRSPPHSPPHSPPSPHSPPPSPPHSPSPQLQPQALQQQRPRTTRSSRRRSRERSRHRSQEQLTAAAPVPSPQERSHDRVPAHERLGERVHEKSHERSHDRSHERSYDRSHDRSHERSYDRGAHERSNDRCAASHERSHERSRERSDHDGGDRAVKYSSSRDKSSRQRSRERSREQSEHRSVSLARSHNAELWEKEYPEPRESGREYSGSREGSGKEKRDKRGRERRRSREDKRDKRKSLEEFEETGDVNRRGRYNSPESGHEGGPRTPPPPLPPPPATRRGWRGEEEESGADQGDEGPDAEGKQQTSGSKRRRLERNRDLGDGAGGDLDGSPAPAVNAAVPDGGPLLFGDDMEAITDDEDLPDVQPEVETVSNAAPQQGEAVEEGNVASERPPVTAAPTGGAEFDFEEIMSDEEELPEYQEFEEEGVEEEYIVEEWEDWLKPFTLLEFQCVAPSVRLTSPALTHFQAGVLLGVDKGEEEIVSKLVSSMESCSLPGPNSTDEDREGFVHACEQVAGLLPSCLHLLPQDKLRECVTTLCGWADVGLDMEESMAQAQPIYKIRHLKAGLRLVVCLLQCSDDITQLLLTRLPLMHRLHHLYHLQHMALSIKLLILRTMDSILSCGAGVRQFLGMQANLDLTGYEVLLQLLAATTHTRAKVAVSAILRKLHLLEALEKLRDDVTSLQGLLPPPPLLHPAMEGVEEAPLGCEMTPKDCSIGAATPFLASGPVDEECEAMETDGVLVTGGGPSDDWCPEEGDLEVGAGVVGEDEEVDDEDVLGERDEAGGLAITVPRQLITSITSCLKHILHTFRHAPHLLSQPHRYFPVSKQFHVPSCPYDVMQEVFTLLDHGDLIPSLASLFTCLSYGLQLEPLDAECIVSREPPLLSVSALLVQLLRAVAESWRGLTYLAAHHAETTVLLRGLLKCRGGCRLGRSEFSCSDVLADEASIDPLSDPCLDLQDCGVQLLERLHAHHQLDSLALIAATTAPLDLMQGLVHLNTLAGMLLTHHSKMSLVTTLATGDYIQHLYPYLTMLQPNDTTENTPLKVACFGYAVELLAVTVRLGGDMRFMEKHADVLCQIIETEETREGPSLDESVKLLELMPWLSVARKPETLSYDTIPHLVDVVKDQLEHVDKFPGELFTALRVLMSLAIPRYVPIPYQQSSEENNGDVFQELKYKYAVLQLFYADLTSHLNSLLTKLCALFPQPALHTSQLSGAEGACLVNLLQPALALLYCLLQKVIQARGAAYHDLSSVQPLLSTYLLVSAFPLSSPHGSTASQLQRKVLQTLLLYTQPGHHPDTPCNSNSLWVQMLAQIIKFCEHLPHKMVPGLCLLTELLPLPLPVVGRQLTKEEQERCVVVRNLWAANLSPLAESLYRLLHHLAPASQPALTHALRRTCIALADLAPQMVVVIVRPLLDLALQYQRADAAASTTINTSASNSMSRIVYMVASLASHSGCKAAILHLFTTEPYNVLLPNWCSAITQGLEGDGSTPAQTLRQHHAPLCLLMHHLCNTHKNMQGKLEGSLWGVPCRELLSPMLECLVAMLSFTSIEHRVLHPLLATLNDAITHDYGLFHLKSVMDKRKGCLKPLLQRLATDIPSSKSGMDALPTLQGLLELCHGLLASDNVPRLVICKSSDRSTVSTTGPTVPQPAPEFIPLRTMCVSLAELCVYVAWDHCEVTTNTTKFESEKGFGEKTITDTDGSVNFVEGKDDQQSSEEKMVKPEELSAAAGDVNIPTETAAAAEGAAAAVLGVTTTVAGTPPSTAVTSVKDDTAQDIKGDMADAIGRVTLGVHPLRVLEDVVADVPCNESVIEQLYSEVVELIAVLESTATDHQGPVLNKVSDAWESSSSGDSYAGMGGGSIRQQYEERLICCSSSGNEEPPSLWLQQPPTLYGNIDHSGGAAGAGPGSDGAASQDSGPDMVAVSLGQLLRDCGAGDYDLEGSAQKVLCGHQAGGSPQKPAALSKGPAKFKSNPVPLRPGSRGMRPFSFATRGMNLRTDPFRCRPPNTSRPPSLHVDDFVALESTGHQPTGPTGYNRISFGRGKMLLDSMRGGRGGRGMMGRGAGGDSRGGPMTGGRFMYRPPMYRPDFNNRGMMNRGMRWNFRGGDGGGMMRGGSSGPMGMNGGGQYRPQGPGPMRFMRGRGMFTRGSPGGGGYNDRGMRHMRGSFH